MRFTTIVRLKIDDENARPLSGVKVALYDRDRITSDDHLGTEVTDEAGEAVFHYSTEDFYDLDERFGGEFPDLYVIVYAPSGEQVFSTRADAIENTAARHMEVRVPSAIVAQHNLASVAA